MNTTTVPRPHSAHRTTDPAPADEAGPPPPVLAVDLVTDPALPGHLASLAPRLERSGIGALTVSDGGLHPVHVASFLAPLTRPVALLPRADAVYVEPFHLATQLMSLDHLSHGRAGWLIRAETDPAVAATVGRPALDLAATAREAADVLAASRLLWDSWAEDAVVRDAERGLYVDASRLQYADFAGETFSVRGPSITPRSPQGLLPVLSADADRDVLGGHAGAVDGRVLDVDVSGGARAERIAEVLAAATAPGDATGPAAVRLVRLVGLDLEADPVGIVTALTEELRGRGLIAPAPRDGQSLREQLGLPRPARRRDPARRADRARHAPKEPA